MSRLDSLRDWLERRRETMTCRAAVELMTDYLEQALDDHTRVRFEAHLATCAACTAYLEQMRATIALSGSLEPEALDPEVRAGLLAIYRAIHAAPSTPRDVTDPADERRSGLDGKEET
jgi:anti-sigma factor RsiW